MHGRLSSFSARRAVGVLFVALPVVALSSVMVFFSFYRISPAPSVEGSPGNPLGLLTSNFVYDGSVNVENVVTSSAFLLMVLLYLPRALRVTSAYLLPLIAVAVGGFAQLTAISSVYVTPRICGSYCSFYGMSGLSNAVIGYTFAAFLICFGLIALQRKGRLVAGRGSVLRPSRPRDQLALVCAFAAYVFLLLLFAGLVTLPAHQVVVSGNGGTPTVVIPPPPAILVQPPPTALVHAASITYGFIFCVAIVVAVNRRYRAFVPPETLGAGGTAG